MKTCFNMWHLKDTVETTKTTGERRLKYVHIYQFIDELIYIQGSINKISQSQMKQNEDKSPSGYFSRNVHEHSGMTGNSTLFNRILISGGSHHQGALWSVGPHSSHCSTPDCCSICKSRVREASLPLLNTD